MNENEFKYKGKTYVAVENESFEICENCVFKAISTSRFGCGMLQGHGEIPPCSAPDRRDNKDVHFIEKGKQK